MGLGLSKDADNPNPSDSDSCTGSDTGELDLNDAGNRSTEERSALTDESRARSPTDLQIEVVLSLTANAGNR
uniref:Uncharacterized protein n=1 Tax=Magallana gigas TaxID=29159 RepID=K1Q612_MAGGI